MSQNSIDDVLVYGTHYNNQALAVTARNPFRIEPELLELFQAEFNGCDRDEDFKALRASLAEQGLSVPVLYKHYSQATWPEGVNFAASNVDHEFGDCVHSFVLADLDQLKPRKRKRYLGEECSDGRTET